MSVKTYPAGQQLTPHFNSSEFKCKCCGAIKIDIKLLKLLESLFPALDLQKINVISGYRCPKHDKEVNGRGTGSHTMGCAADVRCFYKDGSVVPSSVVALTLERMGHACGIGYRCGGVADSRGNIHVDVRPRKWYGDESKSMTKSACTSFFDYLLPFDVRIIDKTGLNIRNAASTGRVVGTYKYGDTARIVEVNKAHTWGRTAKGWICLKDKYVRFGMK